MIYNFAILIFAIYKSQEKKGRGVINNITIAPNMTYVFVTHICNAEM